VHSKFKTYNFEFAFNVINKSEDQNLRLIICWKEIYENASGLGKAGNAIGVYFSI
jgi:hypothetical protein